MMVMPGSRMANATSPYRRRFISGAAQGAWKGQGRKRPPDSWLKIQFEKMVAETIMNKTE
jgi:hypothetical protein